MKTTIGLLGLLLLLSAESYGQATQVNTLSTSALDYKVARFNLTDSTLIEGLSKLSLEGIAGLLSDSRRSLARNCLILRTIAFGFR